MEALHEAASLRARVNIWSEGQIVWLIREGWSAEAVAAVFPSYSLDEIAEIVTEWNTDGPGRDYLDRQFAIHVANHTQPFRPEELAKAAAGRLEAIERYNAAKGADQQRLRQARERRDSNLATLGISLAQRNQQIFDLRRAGLEFRSIGARFKISVERARQIFLKYDRIETRHCRRRHGRPIDMGGPRGVWIDYDLPE